MDLSSARTIAFTDTASIALAILLTLLSSDAFAVTTEEPGPTFLVNSYTTGAQSEPFVVMHPQGHYIVVWTSSGQDGDAQGVFARVMNADGTPVTSEFQVNVGTTGVQRAASAAVAPDDTFVVVWRSGDQILGRRFSITGEPLSGEFPAVATSTRDPSFGIDAQGNLDVAYALAAPYQGERADVLVQRLDASHNLLGTPMEMGASYGLIGNPEIDVKQGGDFVVVWHDELYTMKDPYTGQYYEIDSRVKVVHASADGQPIGAPNVAPFGNENRFPRVAANQTGFVVVWSSCYSHSGEYEARSCYRGAVADAQRFDVNDERVNSTFDLSQHVVDYGSLVASDVALQDSGRFTVVWSEPFSGGSGGELLAQQFGVPPYVTQGPLVEIEPNTGVRGDVRITKGPGDDFLVTWAHDDDIYARNVHVTVNEACPEAEVQTCNQITPGRGRAKIRSGVADKPDLVRLVWRGNVTSLACLVDAGVAAGARLGVHLYKGFVGSLTYVAQLDVSAPLCGSSPCWRFEGDHVAVYEDANGMQDGITFVRVRVGPKKGARIVMRAEGANVPVPDLPVTDKLRVNLYAGPPERSAFCAGAWFVNPKKNTPRRYFAVGGSPATR